MRLFSRSPAEPASVCSFPLRRLPSQLLLADSPQRGMKFERGDKCKSSHPPDCSFLSHTHLYLSSPVTELQEPDLQRSRYLSTKRLPWSIPTFPHSRWLASQRASTCSPLPSWPLCSSAERRLDSRAPFPRTVTSLSRAPTPQPT